MIELPENIIHIVRERMEQGESFLEIAKSYNLTEQELRDEMREIVDEKCKREKIERESINKIDYNDKENLKKIWIALEQL